MTDNDSIGSSGKPTIGDESNFVPQALADNGGGGRQHFPHTRSSSWAFKTNDHDIACLNAVIENGIQTFLFRVEDTCRACDVPGFDAGNFCDSSLFAEVALQNDQMTFCSFGSIQWQDDILILARLIGNVRQVFGYGFPGCGHTVAMQESSIQQHLHHLWNAAGMVQVDGNIFA